MTESSHGPGRAAGAGGPRRRRPTVKGTAAGPGQGRRTGRPALTGRLAANLKSRVSAAAVTVGRRRARRGRHESW